MKISLKSKLIGGAVCSLILTCALSALSYTITAGLGYELRQVETLAVALRNHTLADMYHEGLRGNVYSALFAAEAEPGRKDEILKETRETAKQFREAMGKNDAVSLPQEARGALNGIKAPLEAYIEIGEKLVTSAFSDRAKAISMLKDFDERFSALEVAQDKAGDKIEEAAKEQTAEAAAYRYWALLAATIASLLGLIVCVGLIWIVLRETLRPLSRLQDVMQRLAAGDHKSAIPYEGRPDEIGSMAHAIEVFRLRAIEQEKLQKDIRVSRDKERQHEAHIQDQVTTFKEQVSQVLNALKEETGRLHTAAGTLTENAAIASKELNSASQASSGVAENSNAVATATEELGASIREISSQAQRSRDIVRDAAVAAAKTDTDVASLAEAAQRIESVVMLIRSIAHQTNLLALNATIEAARAGESGKGFAVVASEVKQLSSETSKATEEIAKQISDIQTATTMAIESIRAIVAKVADIETLTSSIAAAVEEQDAATNEIARNISLSAQGSHTASVAVENVTTAANKTNEEALMVSQTSGRLAKVSNDISGAVTSFIAGVDATLEDRRKQQRHSVNWATVLTQQHQKYETLASNLSLTGIRVGRMQSLASGQHVMVDFGMGPIASTVSWSSADGTGLKFDTPLKQLPDLDVEPGGKADLAA